MLYRNVCLEAFGYVLPEEVVTSEALEEQLEPLYSRLRLPAGRLELMTGIRERRFWPRGTLPGDVSVESGERAIRAARIDRLQIGALVHGSVCRDYLEPATACGVHQRLGLGRECMIYDVSNACLGLLNGMVQAANMIELGQIRAALVVGTESSRQLVENTVRSLNADQSLSRAEMKLAVASLTIGSGSAAVLLCDRELSRTGNRLLGGVAAAETSHCELCRSGRDEASAEMQPLMRTDSEALLHAGIELATATFRPFGERMGWRPEQIDKTFCHQVGSAHRKLLLEALGLDAAIDFPTYPWLGDTGAVALPLATALGAEAGHLEKGDRVALLGISSGVNCLMLAVDWQTSLAGGSPKTEARHPKQARIAAERVTQIS